MEKLYFSDINDYVKSRLDELSNNDDALLVSGSNAVEDLEKEIERAVVPSVRKIHLDAPNILLKDGLDMVGLNEMYVKIDDGDGELRIEPSALNFPWEGGSMDTLVFTESEWRTDAPSGNDPNYMVGDFVCLLEIPMDFLRLITLKLSCWKRPIQTFIGEDSVEYRKQQNRFLRGTTSRPVGVLTHGVSGRPVAELFTSSSNAANQVSGQYYPEPKPSKDSHGEFVLVCQPLKYPCLDQITATVLRMLARHKEADAYERLAALPFRIDPDWAKMNPPTSERFNTQQ